MENAINDLTKGLNRKAVADDGADRFEPCPWIITVMNADETCNVGVVEVKETHSPRELAGLFADAAAAQGGVRGHARNIKGPEGVIFFACDGDGSALAEYANSYEAMSKGPKGFGKEGK